MSSVFKRVSLYAIANAVPAGMSFFLLPIYTRYLAPGDYGLIASMETVSAIFAIVANLCLDRSAFRFYFDTTDAENRRKILSTLFFSGALGFITLLALSVLLKDLIVLAFPTIPFFPYYFLAFVTAGLTTCINFIFVFFQISERPKEFLIFSVLRASLLALSNLLFVVYLKKGALGQIEAGLWAAGLFLPLAFGRIRRHFILTIDSTIITKGLQYSLPIIPTMLTAWALNMSDRIFIDHYIGQSELGIYSMGYKIASIFFLITSAFSMAYQPDFLRMINSSPPDTKTLQANSHRFAMLFVITAFAIALTCPEIIHIFLNHRYLESYKIAQIILLSHLLSGLMGISSNLFYIQAKKTVLQMYIIMACTSLNVAMNFWLIPTYGITGAAIATTLAMMVMTCVHYRTSMKFFYIPLGWPRIIGAIGLGALVVTVSDVTLTVASLEGYLIKSGILLLLASLCAYSLRSKLKSVLYRPTKAA